MRLSAQPAQEILEELERRRQGEMEPISAPLNRTSSQWMMSSRALWGRALCVASPPRTSTPRSFADALPTILLHLLSLRAVAFLSPAFYITPGPRHLFFNVSPARRSIIFAMLPMLPLPRHSHTRALRVATHFRKCNDPQRIFTYSRSPCMLAAFLSTATMRDPSYALPVPFVSIGTQHPFGCCSSFSLRSLVYTQFVLDLSH